LPGRLLARGILLLVVELGLKNEIGGDRLKLGQGISGDGLGGSLGLGVLLDADGRQ
jgi:hypothetical protein